MKPYLLDSNVLIHVVNQAAGHALIQDRLIRAHESGHAVLVSAVTVWEIFRMAEKAKASSKATRAALNLLSKFRTAPLSREAAALGGAIHARLAKAGKTIGERDSMIAGAALAGGCTLVTDNTNEFSRVPGLTLENWRLP